MLDYLTILEKWHRFILFLGVNLIAYQIELAEELLKFPLDAKITQARQTGKSFIMGILVFFIAYVLKWNIIISAPVLWQTGAIMKEAHKVKRFVDRKMRRQGKGRLRIDTDNKYELSFIGRGSIKAISGSETARSESASANLVIVDEHQDLTWMHVSEVFGSMLGSSILFQSKKTGGLTPFWSCGIGGEVTTVGERGDVDFEWELPWQDAYKILIDTDRPNDAELYKTYVGKRRESMFPEQFAAHFECKRLDTSEKLLVPEIQEYEILPDGTIVTVGFDFGRSIDKTIGTELHRVPEMDLFFIKDWLSLQGSFDMQNDKTADWLNSEALIWDHLKGEVNGIGAGPVDFLSREFPEIDGITVNARWKTRGCQKISRLAANGGLKYNPNAKLARVFATEITAIKYQMTNTSEITIPPESHSDFLSSLLIALDEPKWGSVSI